MQISLAAVVVGIVFGAGLLYWGNRFRRYRRTTIILYGIGGGGTPRQPLAPPLAVTRSEENAASKTGSWSTYGSETGTFSNGTLVASDVVGSTATFSFIGTAVSWIGVKCDSCGVANVSIDGGAPTSVDTAGGPAGSLVSEAVFYASGLASGVSHTIAITVTGTHSTMSTGANIAVDAFDVMP